MKKNIFTLFLSITLVFAFSFSHAQAPDPIIFDASNLEPPEDGYYIKGTTIMEDGIPVFYNGCSDGYEDYNTNYNFHAENKTQQNFSYVNGMVMPDCTPKGTPSDPPVQDGYIQLRPSVYLGTDSAIYGAIISPEISNLKSITVETSSDVSINANREVPFNIEYSKDGGKTWEYNQIMSTVENQGGFKAVFDTEDLVVKEMADASKVAPIILRLYTNDRAASRPKTGQYVNIHLFEIAMEALTAIKDLNTNKKFFNVYERNISAIDTPIRVYNLMGQVIGSGQMVNVPSKGIYFVKNNEGNAQKVFVK